MTKSKKTVAVPPFIPPPLPPRPSVRRVLFSRDFLSGVAAGLLFFLLLANIIVSQTISPLYFNLVRGDQEAAEDFLRMIKYDKNLGLEFTDYQRIFGADVVNEVFGEDQVREAKIKRLEEALQKNPQSRDALYALYQLYLEKKDHSRANHYLKMAREQDPDIK